jgi:hypothetical protein
VECLTARIMSDGFDARDVRGCVRRGVLTRNGAAFVWLKALNKCKAIPISPKVFSFKRRRRLSEKKILGVDQLLEISDTSVRVDLS